MQVVSFAIIRLESFLAKQKSMCLKKKTNYFCFLKGKIAKRNAENRVRFPGPLSHN